MVTHGVGSSFQACLREMHAFIEATRD